MLDRNTMTKELSEWHGFNERFFTRLTDQALQSWHDKMMAGKSKFPIPARAQTPISIPI